MNCSLCATQRSVIAIYSKTSDTILPSVIYKPRFASHVVQTENSAYEIGATKACAHEKIELPSILPYASRSTGSASSGVRTIATSIVTSYVPSLQLQEIDRRALSVDVDETLADRSANMFNEDNHPYLQSGRSSGNRPRHYFHTPEAH